jgi:hypothetical protein
MVPLLCTLVYGAYKFDTIRRPFAGQWSGMDLLLCRIEFRLSVILFCYQYSADLMGQFLILSSMNGWAGDILFVFFLNESPRVM